MRLNSNYPRTGTCTSTVVVTDLVSGDVVALQRVTAQIGEQAVAQIATQTTGGDSEIELTLFADATRATYLLEATRAGRLVARQKSSVKH